jgi:guanylate kinase
MSEPNICSGSLFMVVAPSGAGKSTLVNALLAQEPSIKLSVSFTTRPPRLGEQHGREYYFTSTEDFLKRRESGEFLESAEVHGNYYGTSRLMIAEQMKSGTDVLLEIDWQGAQQIKKQFPHAVGIFILPPSIAALEERLKKRGQDEPNVITRRILAAGGEIAHALEFEYVIINHDFATALSELTAIVQATRCRFPQQAARNTSLFAQLGIHANLS